MTDKYEIVKYRPEFKPQVLDLQKHLWSPDIALNRAYFEWKYEQNPYIQEPLIYLALHHTKVIGMRGMYGAKWQIGSPPSTFIAPLADDLVIAPEHRNRGVFTRIMSAAFDDLASKGYRYLFSLSGGRRTVLGSLTMGWKSVGPGQPVGWRAKHAVVFQSARRAVGQLRFFWRYANAPILFAKCEHQPFIHLDRAGASRLIRGNDLVSLERRPQTTAMAKLVEQLCYDGRIRHVRDQEYLLWRFRNPRHEFRFLYWGDQQLKGYLVLQRMLPGRVNTYRVHIRDWEGMTDTVRKDLLGVAVRCGSFAELVIWTATLPETIKRLLQDQSFDAIDRASRARGHPTILVMSVRDEGSGEDWTIEGRSVLDVRNWDLRMLYHE
jgi:GNAT superfamily N-acetyltransferase